jgi:prepilin-type N-terminal cleavage/methylation domain-containing protein
MKRHLNSQQPSGTPATRVRQLPRACPPGTARKGEAGFSLIEVAVALVIILIAVLGVFMTITYAITYNLGNDNRSKSLAVLQEQVERIRSAKFTPTVTDVVLQGGTTTRTVTSNGRAFIVTTTVDNDPFTNGIQDETVFTNIKEITVTASLAAKTSGWQTAIPATVVLRRVKSN